MKPYDEEKEENDVMTHRELVQIQRKGYRSGAWRKLNGLDRSFFRVSILYSGLNGKIVNSRILTQLKNIIKELTSTFREKIIRVSFERTRKMIGTFEEREVFSWAPELRAWLDRPEFLFWMGVTFG